MGDTVTILDRRRSCRHSLRIPLRLRLWGMPGSNSKAKSVNISEEGALLETELLLRVGAFLDLRIKLPEEITSQPTTEWRCKARVVHVAHASSVDHSDIVGVHFDWLDAARG